MTLPRGADVERLGRGRLGVIGGIEPVHGDLQRAEHEQHDAGADKELAHAVAHSGAELADGVDPLGNRIRTLVVAHGGLAGGRLGGAAGRRDEVRLAARVGNDWRLCPFSAASEAAIRSAGVLPVRPRVATPGSIGWSGGRFGSIGRRSLLRSRARDWRWGLGRGPRLTVPRRGSHHRGGWLDRRRANGGDRRGGVGRRRDICGLRQDFADGYAATAAAQAGLDHGEAVDHMAEGSMYRFKQFLRASHVALEAVGVLPHRRRRRRSACGRR